MKPPTLSPDGRQTTLEALLVMAYNVGRDHGAKNTMPITDGRLVILELQRLVDGVDPGDLSKTLAENGLI